MKKNNNNLIVQITDILSSTEWKTKFELVQLRGVFVSEYRRWPSSLVVSSILL